VFPFLGTIDGTVVLACGTITNFCVASTVRILLFNVADDRLPTIVHVDMLDAHKLLPSATQASENLNLGCVSPH
jgi:hypothetical protein